METIADGIYHLDEVVGGPSILVETGRITLVDAGMPGDEDAILAAVASLGRRPDEVKVVLITHADQDHVGALPAIVEATGAEVYASAAEAPIVEGRSPMRMGETLPAVRVAHRVADGETLPLQGGIEVVGTPGHTLGHVAYYVGREGVLLAGDCLNNYDGAGMAGSLPMFTTDAEQARQAVRRVAELRPRAICFGHGPSVVNDAADLLQALAAGI